MGWQTLGLCGGAVSCGGSEPGRFRPGPVSARSPLATNGPWGVPKPRENSHWWQFNPVRLKEQLTKIGRDVFQLFCKWCEEKNGWINARGEKKNEMMGEVKSCGGGRGEWEGPHVCMHLSLSPRSGAITKTQSHGHSEGMTDIADNNAWSTHTYTLSRRPLLENFQNSTGECWKDRERAIKEMMQMVFSNGVKHRPICALCTITLK